jgi:hypothetical protein
MRLCHWHFRDNKLCLCGIEPFAIVSNTMRQRRRHLSFLHSLEILLINLMLLQMTELSVLALLMSPSNKMHLRRSSLKLSLTWDTLGESALGSVQSLASRVATYSKDDTVQGTGGRVVRPETMGRSDRQVWAALENLERDSEF